MPRCGCHGKPGEVVVGAVVAEIVEQQERIELVGVAEPEGALQLDAGAFHGGGGLDDALDGSNGHVARPCTGIATANLGMKERMVQAGLGTAAPLGGIGLMSDHSSSVSS